MAAEEILQLHFKWAHPGRSAVDASVGASLWRKCIKGVMGGKTRVLVTHALQYLPEVDQPRA